MFGQFWLQNRPLEGIYFRSFLGPIFGRFLGSKCRKNVVFIVLRSLKWRKLRTKTSKRNDFRRMSRAGGRVRILGVHLPPLPEPLLVAWARSAVGRLINIIFDVSNRFWPYTRSSKHRTNLKIWLSEAKYLEARGIWFWRQKIPGSSKICRKSWKSKK